MDCRYLLQVSRHVQTTKMDQNLLTNLRQNRRIYYRKSSAIHLRRSWMLIQHRWSAKYSFKGPSTYDLGGGGTQKSHKGLCDSVCDKGVQKSGQSEIRWNPNLHCIALSWYRCYISECVSRNNRCQFACHSQFSCHSTTCWQMHMLTFRANQDYISLK